MYQLLDWDSSFFGFPVARIETRFLEARRLAAILEEMRKTGIELAYWFAEDDVATAQAAEESKGFLADRKTTYAKEFGSLPPDAATSDVSVTLFESDVPTPELEELAIQSGVMSRFRVDPQVPAGKCEELYRIWIRRIAKGELGDGILSARLANGPIAGMVTLGEKDGRADIGLLAVHSWARGRSLGRRLVAEAQRQFIARGFTNGQVVTQGGNLPACRLYEACGYRVEKVEFVYHFWLRP